MSVPEPHVSDEVLSGLIDQDIQPATAAAVRAHLGDCADCQTRFGELQHLVGLLGRMPSVEPRRTFRLGPVALPSHVRRLARWYGVARTTAASLAAVFVVLVGASLYLQTASRPGVESLSSTERALPAQAPAVEAPAPANPAPRSAAAGQAALRSAAAPDTTDQVVATTSVQPLPTLTRVVAPTPAPSAAGTISASEAIDPTVALRTAASVAGALMLVAVSASLVIRRRLRLARAAATPVRE